MMFFSMGLVFVALASYFVLRGQNPSGQTRDNDALDLLRNFANIPGDVP